MKKKIKQSQTGEFIKSGFNVIVSHRLPSHISLDLVFADVKSKVPSHLLVGLDYVYVGEFSFLKERELNAMYKDGALFISNDQDDQDDMVDDIIHEIAHLVEDNYNQFLYQDQTILKEFLSKRESLYHLLESEKDMFDSYFPNYGLFTNPDYSQAFDMFLYKQVGYENLTLLTVNIFYSPYAATSLREYFANGFEAFFHHKDIARLKNISPFLFKKISNLESIKA